MIKFISVIFLTLSLPRSSLSVTHWIQNENIIIPLASSPFNMKNSNDLVAFLNQSAYKKKLDYIMNQLLQIKSNLTQKMNRLDLYSNLLPNKISCIPEFFIDENDLYNQPLSRSYLQRLSYKISLESPVKTSPPICSEFLALDFSVGLFEHLESMRKRHKLKMEPEDSLGSKELGVASLNFPHVMYSSLKSSPNSWKLYLLSSYYWRLKGNAKEAIECARRSLWLAPRKYKDMPLLSLGTILQRSNYSMNDSVVVIKAAVDHSPKISENLWSLGNTYLMMSQFNKSLELFHLVEKIDSAYSARVDFIKKSINCFRDLKITLITMENSLDDILPGLEQYGKLKKEFEDYHKKLEQEQVPLKMQYFDTKLENHKDIQRIQQGQICSPKYNLNDEPVLLCDFLSDVQLIMQDFALNSFVDLKKELIATYKINLGIFKKIFVENYLQND